MTRYETLLQLIDIFRPQSIIEVGTWNGTNAVRMIKQAEKYHPRIKYTGYDLFEEATAETDAVEMNVKAHPKVADVLAYIESYCPNADIGLVKGNTRETLKPGTEADFAFIDGGHSVETVRHDHLCLETSRIIIHDDYYANGPDTKRYGCNSMVEQMSHFVLPQADPVKGGGTTQLVLILNG